MRDDRSDGTLWQKLKAILTSSATQVTTLMALKVFASN